jgi:hypothetical protein
MLAIAVATTRRLVAERNIEALVKASIPRASPNHSAAYPNSSISATASLACGAGTEGVEVRAPEADLSSQDRGVWVVLAVTSRITAALSLPWAQVYHFFSFRVDDG